VTYCCPDHRTRQEQFEIIARRLPFHTWPIIEHARTANGADPWPRGESVRPECVEAD
jgi:hypothetical protein